MGKIVFFDTEVTIESKKLCDIGAIKDDKTELRTTNRKIFADFAKGCEYVCGHNIFAHDLTYVKDDLEATGESFNYIDTLFLSPLLFPQRPYHKLLKDDRLVTNELNNPLNDAIKARDLFYDEVTAFNYLPSELKNIFCSLLERSSQFSGFFSFINYHTEDNAEVLICRFFKSKICSNVNIGKLISDNPIELAYCLSLINVQDKYSIVPPWVVKVFPMVNTVMNELRNTPCKDGCEYCRKNLSIKAKLKDYFGFDDFRRYNGEPLQENATQAAVDGKSLLAIFPTGGGKSLTFQLPALMAGDTAHGLTVVISPLQSLMKDQVDNLMKRGIVDAVTINGLLDPIERMDAINRVANGIATILYIAPESLRSATIEHLLLNRNVVRFVIDEAHCFSAWGQDFRVDYMYIGDFIKSLQEKKKLKTPIPVSCFTATAKQKVITDICDYFREKLGLELQKYSTDATRENLHYTVLFQETEEEKYCTLRNLIQVKNCPTIVYVARTRSTKRLSERLSSDGIPALAFYGKMESNLKIKNQNEFMTGEVSVIVATSAFGMGVDKDNVGLVIHYDISDSLENYVQEAGRAGRDQSIHADCYVLFNDNDLNKHFTLLNQTKLSMNEIQQVWKAVKLLCGPGKRFTKTPLEIARAAGWDDEKTGVETRVKTALYVLEDAGYIKRENNVPRVYATGILAHNMEEAGKLIDESAAFSDNQKRLSKQIISFLISRKSHAMAGTDEAESRVDYIADRLGVRVENVVDSVNLMREQKVLADSCDMTAYKFITQTQAEANVRLLSAIENYLIDNLPNHGNIAYKELNSDIILSGVVDSTIEKLKDVLTYWETKGYLRKMHQGNNDYLVCKQIADSDILRNNYEHRVDIAAFIIEYLFNKKVPDINKSEIMFSVLELQEAYNNRSTLFSNSYKATIEDIKNVILYLKNTKAMSLGGGFLVFYNAIQVKRTAEGNNIRFKKDDYQKLQDFYTQRIQQIHIVGEYAHLMVKDYDEALVFVQDYFQMDYSLFRRKYFKGNRNGEINRCITPERYNKLFGDLSVMQRKIIDDDSSKYTVVAAGPGSGKTKVLVHKLASLLMLEDVRSEQLLMLTFSRSAATEFKKRLIDLIGEAAYYVDIKTFHSYCFDILGKLGSLEETDNVITEATERILNGTADINKITKTVMVIDEAQDMDENAFALVKAMMEQNEEMRIIAVGDDDQNIYEFRKSNSKYMRSLISEYGAIQYELLDNYRSDRSIVSLANAYASTIRNRMKAHPIIPVSGSAGVTIITKYDSPNLEIPTLGLIRDTYESGTCCVLTSTNDQALRITGMLNKQGYHARLIQSNDGFNLYNLYEIRTFISMLGDKDKTPIITPEVWSSTVVKFKKRFRDSTCLSECLNLFNAFVSVNKKIYLSDFLEFISESSFEDFIDSKNDTVFVSTIHKSKGREFDSVYMVLNNYSVYSDEERHTLYVGMTRAKHELYINYNNSLLDNLRVPGIPLRVDTGSYDEPDEILMQLSYTDVFLDYFKDKQGRIDKLYSGAKLFLEGDYLKYNFGQYSAAVLKLSKAAHTNIQQLVSKGYTTYKAEVRFVVSWKAKDDIDGVESLIVLPNIYMRKEKTDASVQIKNCKSGYIQ